MKKNSVMSNLSRYNASDIGWEVMLQNTWNFEMLRVSCPHGGVARALSTHNLEGGRRRGNKCMLE